MVAERQLDAGPDPPAPPAAAPRGGRWPIARHRRARARRGSRHARAQAPRAGSVAAVSASSLSMARRPSSTRLFEPGCVEPARSEPSYVPGRLGNEHVGAERLAQLRDVHLQGVRGRPRRRLAPQLVDQPLHRDDLVPAQEQCREQRPLLRAPESEGAAAEAHLERAEDQELGSLSGRAHWRLLELDCRDGAGQGGL